jgi:hypothetical protein
MMLTPTPAILTIREASRRYGLTQAWLKREAAAGRLPAIIDGPRVVFSAPALERALARLAEGGVPHAD